MFFTDSHPFQKKYYDNNGGALMLYLDGRALFPHNEREARSFCNHLHNELLDEPEQGIPMLVEIITTEPYLISSAVSFIDFQELQVTLAHFRDYITNHMTIHQYQFLMRNFDDNEKFDLQNALGLHEPDPDAYYFHDNGVHYDNNNNDPRAS